MANQFTIKSVFSAVDHMTTPLEKMNTKVGQLGDRIDKAGKSMGQRFGNLGKIAKGAGVAMGTAALTAGAAVFSLSTHAQEAADSIADTANSLGISTKALQEYRYVAALSGMETADMDAALTKLTVNLGKGGKEMDATLAMLGLTAEQLKAAGPDQTLEMVANGMKNITDPMAKVAVTTQLFGKSSVKMVNALSGGADAIKSLREEAQASGYVMDDLSIAAGTKMGDAMDRLKMTAEGAANKLGIMFVPMMEKAVTGITGFLQKSGPALANTLSGLGGVAETALGAVFPLVQTILENIMPLFKVVEGLFRALAPAFKMLSKLLEKILPAVASLAELFGETLVVALDILLPMLEPVLDILGLVFEILGPIFKILTTVIRGAVSLFKSLPGPVKAALAVLFPMIAIPMMISKAWGPIKAFFAGVWDGIKAGAVAVWEAIPKLVQAAADMATSIWQGVVDFVLGLPDRIVEAFTSALAWITEKIQPLIDIINSVGSVFGGGPVLAGAGAGGASAPLSPQTTTINRNTTTTGKLDVNFGNAPAGTTVKQTGSSPGVKVNMGRYMQ